jgi:hydroxypyruvate reductase
VDRSLHVRDRVLAAGGREYDLVSFSRIVVISIGKAGATFFDAVRELLPADIPLHAVISAPFAPERLTSADKYFAGGHPLPNAASIEAATAALELLRGADASALVLFLISGGASAMFETPLSNDVSLEDLIQLNRMLIGSGAPIRAVNCVRKHLSAVKGGRLAAAAPLATKLSLFLSDVPAGALDALGSGPTIADSTTVAECAAIVEQYLSPHSLPPALQKALAQLQETPKANDAAFQRSEHTVLLDNAALLQAAAASARRLGFHALVDASCDDWEYQAAGGYLLGRLHALCKEHPKCCLISGGEVTVRLSEDPGCGGRNQQFVLHCAQLLSDSDSPMTILSAGSDGIDGNSPAAGGVVDESTWQRALSLGLHPAAHLENFNAYPVFEKLDDGVVTGHTGNNLRDLRILLAGD